jgi:hypothetical protein
MLQLFISDLSGDKSTLHSVDASFAYFSYLLTHGGVSYDPTSQASSTLPALV